MGKNAGVGRAAPAGNRPSGAGTPQRGCRGIAVHVAPSFSTEIGVVVMALSVLSLVGARGGLFVGLVLGLLGGHLCIAWQSAGGRSG